VKNILKAVLIGYIWFMHAQSQTILTLDQCLSLAREYSPRLRTVQNIIRSTELTHDEILTTRLPQLRLTASPIYAPFGRKFGYDPALSNGGQNNNLLKKDDVYEKRSCGTFDHVSPDGSMSCTKECKSAGRTNNQTEERTESYTFGIQEILSKSYDKRILEGN
jgi:hypothetical protein